MLKQSNMGKREKRNKKDMSKWVQFFIGSGLFFFGLFQIFASMDMPTYLTQGILLGQGAILFLWGIRELIESGFK